MERQPPNSNPALMIFEGDDLWGRQLFIVEYLPNIGPVNAKNLLENFGSVSNVINASEKELMEVKSMVKSCSNIRKVINSKYLYFKKEVKEKKL